MAVAALLGTLRAAEPAFGAALLLGIAMPAGPVWATATFGRAARLALPPFGALLGSALDAGRPPGAALLLGMALATAAARYAALLLGNALDAGRPPGPALLLGNAPAALARDAALLLGFALAAALELTPTAALLSLALGAELMMPELAGRVARAAFKAGLAVSAAALWLPRHPSTARAAR